MERVKKRVLEGGHNIPLDTIKRRYFSGLKNFVNLYRDKVDFWLLIDNSQTERHLIAEGKKQLKSIIYSELKWAQINDYVRNKN